MTKPTAGQLLCIIAFVLFLLAALAAVGVPGSWRQWEIPGGLAALALALSLPG